MCEKVLVPTNGIASDEIAIEYALINFPNYDIITIYVINPSKFTYTVGGGGFAPTGIWCQMFTERANNIHEEAQTLAQSFQIQIESVTRIGYPASEILNYTEKEDINHIVISQSSSRGIKRVISGNTTQTVLRNASVPVTVMPEV